MTSLHLTHPQMQQITADYLRTAPQDAVDVLLAGVFKTWHPTYLRELYDTYEVLCKAFHPVAEPKP